MEKFSLSEFELCTQYIYNREILEQDYSGILTRLNVILNRCTMPYESVVEEIFCKYITYKTATEVFYNVPIKLRSVDDITSMIIYKQSQDNDINLLAKVKCLKYGKINDGRKNFLKWQIDRLLLQDEFNMLSEYKSYKEENGIKEFIIPDMITKTFD